MKPSALRIERLLAKVEAEVAPPPRRRYVFYYDEVAEAEAQGLPYVLVPRVLSRREWIERYGEKPPPIQVINNRTGRGVSDRGSGNASGGGNSPR
jgi:hypothetical protein